MKYIRRVAFLIAFVSIMFITQRSFPGPMASAPITAEIQLGVGLSRLKVSGGETVTGRVEVRRNGNTQELLVRLETNNPVARLKTTEIRLKPDQSSAPFEISTSATPIKTSVTVKALLQPADQLQAQRTLEIVPAILKTVSLGQTTLHATHGAKISVRAELNTAAPAGGIELYLDIFCSTVANKLLKLNRANPRITQGRREITFDVEYDRIDTGENLVGGSGSAFEGTTRTINLTVALEGQSTRPWDTIPGIAKTVSFEVVPLRVASLAVQPAVVTGGAESLASFTLSFPPGPNEVVMLSPINPGSTRKVWARLLGTSCSSNIPGLLPLQLTQGVTSYSFKVCTSSVTTSTTATLSVSTRSNNFPASITIQP